MVVVHGVTIRQFLFVGTFFSLYFLSLRHAFYTFKSGKLPFRYKLDSVFPKICLVDVAFLIIVFSTAVFSTVVPFFAHSDLNLAKNEVFSSLLVMLLSFPLFYLIKNKQINTSVLFKFVYYLVFFLSCLHVVLYIGQDINASFIYKYFFFLNTMLGKTSVFPSIMLGHAGVPRIFFTTSIFLPIGIYFSLKQLGNFKLFDHIYLAVNILAIISTMTKSLWIGTLTGLVCYFMFNLLDKESRKNIKRIFIFFVEIFSLVVVANIAIFNSRVLHHFGNSFVYEQDYGQYHASDNKLDEDFKNRIREKFKNNVNAYHDREGSIISNNIKIKQIQLLLKKWVKRPILGYGYGSYLEDFVRSEEAPFSYEMVFFALLMKTGVIGILCWLFLIFSVFYVKYKYRKNNTDDFSCWLFLTVAFILLVQTNPLLLNSAGIAFLLFISADAVRSFTESRSKCSLFGGRKKIYDGDIAICA